MDQYSPKSSPLGSRSPSVVHAPPPPLPPPQQQSDAPPPSGLKMTITLKQKSHFHLMRTEAVPANETTGATNLMAARGLEHSYNKLTTKKMKDTLSSFLVNMPGVIDTPGSQDNSSLRGLIEKPPVGGKEIVLLNQLQLAGFRLHPGPLPEQYRGLLTQVQSRKRHAKHKKHRYRGSETPGGSLTSAAEEGGGGGGGKGEEEREKKREKKHKKHDKDAEERRKKKKEKKKKKNKEEKDS